MTMILLKPTALFYRRSLYKSTYTFFKCLLAYKSTIYPNFRSIFDILALQLKKMYSRGCRVNFRPKSEKNFFSPKLTPRKNFFLVTFGESCFWRQRVIGGKEHVLTKNFAQKGPEIAFFKNFYFWPKTSTKWQKFLKIFCFLSIHLGSGPQNQK